MIDALLSTLRAALADRYRLERELGTGGMATVYLAHDLRHDRAVAIKVMRPEIASSLGASRFLREIRLVARLSHPHILPLFESGELPTDPAGAGDGALLYYVMPCIEGRSVRDRLGETKPLPVNEAIRIATEVATALDYAHRHGIVHRDIKPENILLQDGHALVADFGIGKALASGGETATQTGASVGTPAYMSPEQAAGESVDGRSDLYSLGCMLYEMLVGEPPFTGPNVQAVIAKRFVQTPADVAALRDGVTRPVARALQRALSRTPIDRYDTAAEFVAAMQEAEERSATRSEIPERSIAVMPFANMSADPENEFFADGITEEILSALSQIGDLRVAGRTSSFALKGQKLSLRSVGDQLKVRTVLEGSVRRSGKRVRITAQLLDAADGYQLWSERYDREIEDVFAVQDEIASAIAAKMKTTLATDSAGRHQRATHSIEAYEAFLKGRALLYRRGRSTIEGLACMERALALDPKYGLAWTGIAEGYTILGYYSLISPELAREKAVAAAEKAVQFAPDVADAHCALGAATMMFEWEDRERTARAFERGMTLNSGSTQGPTWYRVFYLGWLGGHISEAIAGLEAIYERDPLSSYVCGMLAILAASDHRPGALDWATRAIALDPDAFLPRFSHQISCAAAGDWAGTVSASQALFAIGGRTPAPLSWYAQALNRTGDVTGAHAVYDELLVLSNRGERATWNLACIAAELGLHDDAERWARVGVQRRDPTIYAYGAGRLAPVEALRTLPVYEELMKTVNFPTHVYRHRM